MGMRRVEILEAACDFLLPIRFGIRINGGIQAIQQGPGHGRAGFWWKLQGCF